MKRVVIKAKITDRPQFVSMLADIGMDFSEPFWQHDRIFLPRGYERNANMPRMCLRTIVKDTSRPASYALVLRRHIEAENIEIINYTVVKDYAETAKILQQLGFELAQEISRQRSELVMGESVKVYLDKIDGLPEYYAKFESNLFDGEKSADVIEDLIKTFEVLKVERDNVEYKNYGELMEERRNG